MAEPSTIAKHVTRLDSEVVLIKSTLTSFGVELHSLKSEMSEGFKEQARSQKEQANILFNALEKQANAKPRFGLDNLAAFLGIGAMFCTVFWMIISQRIDPLKEAIIDGFRRADHESQHRHSTQQLQIDENKSDVRELQKIVMQALRDQSTTTAEMKSMLRICEDNHNAIIKLNTKP